MRKQLERPDPGSRHQMTKFGMMVPIAAVAAAVLLFGVLYILMTFTPVDING